MRPARFRRNGSQPRNAPLHTINGQKFSPATFPRRDLLLLTIDRSTHTAHAMTTPPAKKCSWQPPYCLAEVSCRSGRTQPRGPVRTSSPRISIIPQCDRLCAVFSEFFTAHFWVPSAILAVAKWVAFFPIYKVTHLLAGVKR